MKTTKAHNDRMAKLTFATCYPLYLKKVESKGRTKQELHEVIEWLTGFNENDLEHFIEQKTTFEMFFQQAKLHPNAHLITGKICGYRIEDIEHPLTKQIRCLDKLIEELAKGWEMQKILRNNLG